LCRLPLLSPFSGLTGPTCFLRCTEKEGKEISLYTYYIHIKLNIHILQKILKNGLQPRHVSEEPGELKAHKPLCSMLQTDKDKINVSNVCLVSKPMKYHIRAFDVFIR